MTKKATTGFTLIELLVVIAIIGLLASVVLASLNSAREKGRDARRHADIREVRIALELFYDEHNRYPSAADGNCAHNTSFLGGGCLTVLVDEGYLSYLPTDPENGKIYYYNNWCADPPGTSDQKFRMWAVAETDQGSSAQNWWSDYYIGITTCSDPS